VHGGYRTNGGWLVAAGAWDGQVDEVCTTRYLQVHNEQDRQWVAGGYQGAHGQVVECNMVGVYG
jgi:hypothetical protein